MKMQLPWPFQWAHHVTTTACQVVLVAEMALVTLSVLKSLVALAIWLNPEAPVLQESQMVKPVTFHRSWGHPTLLGLVEMLDPEPEF